jgi:hypothetical protein
VFISAFTFRSAHKTFRLHARAGYDKLGGEVVDVVGDQIPRTMMRPLVNATSSRIYIILSQPRPFHCTAMKLGQMLRSLRSSCQGSSCLPLNEIERVFG